jgi:C4-dicarboxylate-specific signal transduction histidine kinase
MSAKPAHYHPSPLIQQLAWFTRLRWVAGIATIAGVLADRAWFHALPVAWGILGVGAAILLYNLLLLSALRALVRRGSSERLLLLSWTQLLVDFAALTLLVCWTGGINSPLVQFLVLHMVFASLLLPQRMAYAAAASAVAMLVTGLSLTAQFPTTRQGQAVGLAQVVVLFLLVYLTNRITRSLRRQRRRLIRQNRKIHRMARQMRRQQRAMIQHEKMVALGQMAAGVTHEIANPLASMDSLLQLIRRKPERFTAQTIDTLREQVVRITQIIQQMKAFAHPVESQLQLLPLNDVVEQSLSMVHFDARIRRVKVQRHYSAAAGTVPLLPQAMNQVLVNLILNALDAMAEVPEPRLTLRTERLEDEVIIEVLDNGHGIRPEYIRRLFEPFFTTKAVGKGTGLGLSISYSLVRKLGGHITVHSALGEGTTFTVRLPARRGASQDWETPKLSEASSGEDGAGQPASQG